MRHCKQKNDCHQATASLSRCEIVSFLFHKVLDQAAFFRTRPKAFIVQLVSILNLEHYGPGEIVVRQGDAGTTMYFIAEGELNVKLYKDIAKARQEADGLLVTSEPLQVLPVVLKWKAITQSPFRIVATLKSGSHFGEITCFSGMVSLTRFSAGYILHLSHIVTNTLIRMFGHQLANMHFLFHLSLDCTFDRCWAGHLQHGVFVIQTTWSL